MNEATISPSEDPIIVFISSRQDPGDPEMSQARELAINEVAEYPGMKVWAFEDAPASPETARDRYTRNAEKADLVIWLIGSSTTKPIVEEISACMRTQGRLLAFKLPADGRDAETEALIKDVSDYATWKTVENVEELPAHINAALTDEMLRRVPRPGSSQPRAILEEETPGEHRRYQATLGHPGSSRYHCQRTRRRPLSRTQTNSTHRENPDRLCKSRIREDVGSTSAISTGTPK